MKQYILAVILIIIVGILKVDAQKGIISGTVADMESGENIPFATVALYEEGNNAPLKGEVSDQGGKFSFEDLAFGRYRLVTSFIGYETDSSGIVEVSSMNPRIDLRSVELGISRVALEEAEVRAMAKTVNTRIDRKVYRVADFETAQGGAAIDVLNKLPSVSVYHRMGKSRFVAPADFMVYLNGKPTQLDPSMLLGQISGSFHTKALK